MANTIHSAKPIVTLAFSIHRPETIPIMAKQMRQHHAIFLEEPHEVGFEAMLVGKRSIDEYLQYQDLEFPDFTRGMCMLLRELKAEGKRIYQIEPFLESLIGIHEFFAKGHRPKDIDSNSAHYPVYHAERQATAALLTYYQVVMSGSFQQVLNAVKEFAQRDADRFRLRDAMRAQALIPVLKRYSSAYIEAGAIHYALLSFLQQHKKLRKLRGRFLSRDISKKTGLSGHLYGPGDLLTLRYIFHPKIAEFEHDDLLAARSVIYSKIIEKKELTDNLGDFPHVRDDLACIRTVKRLSLYDCHRLFPVIRHANSADARHIVAEYITRYAPHNRNEVENQRGRQSHVIETL